ncbi:MAG: DUF1800 domain-containing protein [Alphaproteobacteria bacterium]|nr:DUF1800 domain-containing protein [Alphaproteobacteria bacterium]
MSLQGAIAAHRFGLGARPQEIRRASGDPKSWLMSQVQSPADQPVALDGQPLMTGAELVADMIAYQRARVKERKEGAATDPVKQFFKNRVALYMNEMAARFALGFTAERPFAERLVHFWSNHFVVSAQNPRVTTLVGAFEREAIRPNIHRTFEDMLMAAVTHPAMLLYLDNAQSVGPDSFGAMVSGKGLNENLGRELMELYTLGVDGGYNQADVIAMAKLLTGFTIDRKGSSPDGFRFMGAIHEPGPIVLRGKTYQAGYNGTIAAIRDLARDPATARYVARKFAAHFVSDTPGEECCARLSSVFLQTGGDLKALSRAVIEEPRAWEPGPGKMRTPVEYVTAAFRLLAWPRGGDSRKQVQAAMAAVRMMGEFPLAAPAPKGWPDDSGSWAGPDAMLNRIEWARELGNRLPAGFTKPMAIESATEGLGELLRRDTLAAMQRVGSAGEALALLLSSPEFQRR